MRFPKPTFKRKSQRRREQNDEYRERRLRFLNQKRWCEANVACRTGGGSGVAHDVHHMAGRDGDKLLDESNWLAVCATCHGWIHAYPAAAYRLGLLLKRN